MKRTLSILLCLILSMALVHGQDARNRTVETIVADVLAQMPAPSSDIFAENMTDIAKSAPRSVELLAEMLRPASEGKNNLVEYALSGIAEFVSDPDNAAYKEAVLKGLAAAAEKCSDSANKQFLLQQAGLLGQLPEEVREKITPADIKNAKALLKSGTSGEMCSAARTLIQAGTPGNALKILKKALKSEDRPLRNAVLGYTAGKAGVGAVSDLLLKKFKSLGTDARTDVINWMGSQKLPKAASLVLSQLDKPGELGAAAVSAAGKIGGKEALAALVSRLAKGGEQGMQALTALKSFKGDVAGAVTEALGADRYNPNLLALASAKHVTGVASNLFELASSDDAAKRALGANLLPGVVGKEDAPKIAGLLDAAGADDVVPLQNVLKSALRNLDGKGKYELVSSLIKGAKNPSRLFPALALSGTDEAVKDLGDAYSKGSAEALESLSSIDNYAAAPILLEAIGANPSRNGKLLKKYISLIGSHEQDLEKKRFEYSQALNLAKDAASKADVLEAIGEVPTMKAFLLAGKYLDDSEQQVAYAAANAVKDIAAKTKEEIDYNTLLTNLTKASDIFGATGSAGDEYYVDQIDNILSKAEPSPISQLTDEEKAEGWEMLFDGTDLSKWQGDLDGYTPVNGTIYVSASYGDDGNLYTKKKYKDFKYRFEFCFLREGENNGVGIRTPMGVDAAYEGMCEVQILDHDAPIYANLREYQVHGSVYGIIPAKRIVHKPLGEWETEEIEVRGTHIKVTVNGEVIVDGDVRKACQGHNVALDGSDHNPYTVDKNNHPGLFNEEGYISFCGHGEGMKIRNVRILDLSK